MKKHVVLRFVDTWWSAGLAILGAVVAQVLLHTKLLWLGVGLYAIAIGLWLCNRDVLSSWWRKPAALMEKVQSWKLTRLQQGLLVMSLCATYVNVGATLGRDTFTWVSVIAWGISVGAFVAAFWQKRPHIKIAGYRLTSSGIHITWFAALFVAIFVLGIFFRMWQLRQVPPEMTLDHTENLLDIRDVVEGGLRPIFFYRNTGHEALIFYWTALLVWLTRHPLDFTILKIGSALCCLLTLPGVYLLARELYGRTVGIWAMGFAAVASWPVILERFGLRVALVPWLSAWSFYYLVRGLRRGERESFLLLGLCLGIGLYSYTAFRIVPFAVAYIWLALSIIEKSGPLHAHLNWRNFGLVVVTALLVFIPLGIFSITHADSFWNRSAWYLNKTADFGLLTFLDNIKNVLLMFNWRGDSMPLSTLPYEPVLDPILGGLFVLGVLTAIKRVMKKADSLTFALIVLGLFSLFPSALAINYPNENPSVVRTSCAIPIVLTLAALPIGLWVESLAARKQIGKWKTAVCAALVGLTVLLTAMNVNRVFVRYPQAYRTLAFNTTEIAAAMRCFDTLMGDLTDAYIVAEPGWINEDALAFELGLPVWENTLETAEQARTHALASRMYILHPGNTGDLRTLQTFFPTGTTQTYTSRYGRNFTMYIVPDANARRAATLPQALCSRAE